MPGATSKKERRPTQMHVGMRCHHTRGEKKEEALKACREKLSQSGLRFPKALDSSGSVVRVGRQ